MRNIIELKENEYFVFGSNKNGYHDGGAAKTALIKFGAEYGNAFGFQGNSYAIPTLNMDMSKVSLNEIKLNLELLADIAKKMPTKIFYLTDVGCGIAGFKIEELESILPILPENIIPTWK